MSFSKKNIILVYIIVLILITKIDCLKSKNKIFSSSKIKWSEEANCYGYVTEVKTSEDPNLKNFYLGKNQVNNLHVYLYVSPTAPVSKCKTDTVTDNNFKIYSYQPYKPDNFNNKEETYIGFMCWIYKTCKSARNNSAGVPETKKEIVDTDVRHKWYSYCNYICRSIYQEELGLCTFYKQNDNYYHCTYLVNK